jgi:hypothetical protein
MTLKVRGTNMNLQFGENIFGEYEIQEMIAKFTNKWVIHLKAVGLIETEVNEDEVWHWYADKTDTQVLNALINSGTSREVYILLDNMEDTVEAYEHWFPREGDLLDEERKYFVRFKALSPDSQYVFTNELLEITE